MASRATPLEVAWVAGLYEGEGCAYLGKNGSVTITIASTDRDVVERVAAIFPSSRKMRSVQPKPVHPSYNPPKRRYDWTLGRPEQVREFLELVLPFLCGRRRAKAVKVLHHLDTRPGTGGNQKARTHCPKGHIYSSENTYVNPTTGYRHCRACRVASATTRRIEHRDAINARRRKPGGRGPYKKSLRS